MKVLSIVLIGVLLSVANALAPLHGVGSDKAIPDEYIVVFRDGFNSEMRDAHIAGLGAAHPTMRLMSSWSLGKFNAFSAVLDKGALARELEHEDVKYIEANQVVTAYDADSTLTQNNAEWGLSRISQKDLPLSGKYSYFKSAGTGVYAYVIDTGIFLTHVDFGGRAIHGANFIPSEVDSDCNGHGTHVAGSVGGLTYGVAKNVTLVAVKVLSCGGSGSFDGVISGITWTAKDAVEKKKRAVANMSLGGPASVAVDDIVEEAVLLGVVFAVAAGNDNRDASGYSPARAPSAITVGATTSADARASFSNFGASVDIFAPGYLIKGPWIGSTTAVNTISGTSMASPHAAGAVAVYLAHHAVTYPNAPAPTPKDVLAHLVSVATSGKITNPGTNSPNRLLFSTYSA